MEPTMKLRWIEVDSENNTNQPVFAQRNYGSGKIVKFKLQQFYSSGQMGEWRDIPVKEIFDH